MAGKKQEQQKEPIPPPRPKEITRKIKLYPLQMVGVPLVALIPLLALFKVFDTSYARGQTEANGLTLSVEYPSKLRFRTEEPLRVLVRNGTGTDLERVEIRLNRDYIEKFREISIEPNVKNIDDRDYIVEAEHVRAGETRAVEISLEADRVGAQEATVSAKAGDVEASLKLTTFVYP